MSASDTQAPQTDVFVAGHDYSVSAVLQPSVWMLVYLSVVHVAALVALWFMLPDLAMWIISLLCLFAHAVFCLWREGFGLGRLSLERLGRRRWAHQVGEIHFQQRVWRLRCAGTLIQVDLIQATVWSWLLALNFRDPVSGRRYSVVILADSLAAQSRRRLQVVLRHLQDY